MAAEATARGLRGWARWAALAAGLLLAACYEVNHEAIPVHLGVVVPYGSDSIKWENGGTTELSRVGFSNDYRFREVSASNQVSTGTFRALHIRDAVYALQARYDGESVYTIVFYAITRDSVDPVEPLGDVMGLAARHGVTIEPADEVDALQGSPAAILAFLRAHAELQFD